MANLYTRPGSTTINLTQKNNQRWYLEENLDTCQIGIETDYGTLGLKDNNGDYFTLTNRNSVYGDLVSGDIPCYDGVDFTRSDISIDASGLNVQHDISTSGDIYIGNRDVDGTWKITKDVSDNLLFQYRTSGSYVTRNTISPS